MRRTTQVALALAFGSATLLGTGCTDDEAADPAGTTATAGGPSPFSAPGPPDVTGTVRVGPGDGVPFEGPRLVDAADGYYELMGVSTHDPAGPTPAPVVVDADGEPADLGDGDRVSIWIADGPGCRESHPVQCDLAAIRIDQRG